MSTDSRCREWLRRRRYEPTCSPPEFSSSLPPSMSPPTRTPTDLWPLTRPRFAPCDMRASRRSCLIGRLFESVGLTLPTSRVFLASSLIDRAAPPAGRNLDWWVGPSDATPRSPDSSCIKRTEHGRWTLRRTSSTAVMLPTPRRIHSNRHRDWSD